MLLKQQQIVHLLLSIYSYMWNIINSVQLLPVLFLTRVWNVGCLVLVGYITRLNFNWEAIKIHRFSQNICFFAFLFILLKRKKRKKKNGYDLFRDNGGNCQGLDTFAGEATPSNLYLPPFPTELYSRRKDFAQEGQILFRVDTFDLQESR